MIDALIAAIAGVVGVVVGWLLSEKSTRDREKQNEDRQARSVKTILKLEIGLNPQALNEFWHRVTQITEQDADSDLRKLRLADRLIEVPLSPLKEAYTAQLPVMGLLTPQEVTGVFHFYGRLDRIKSIRSELVQFRQVAREERSVLAAENPQGYSRFLGNRANKVFTDNAPDLWDECEKLITQLLQEGNPL